MIKSIGKFLSDYGWPIFFAGLAFLFVSLIILVSEAQSKRDRICLERQNVVVKYNGVSYCSNLNSLAPIK
jgi:hypothetical protein